MTDLRNRLRGLGVSEARLSAIGMGAPAATAPATAGEPVNIFRAKYTEQHASKPITEAQRAVNAKAKAALTNAEVEHRCNAMFIYEKYKGADAITRAKIRAEHSSLIELGRKLVDETDPPEAA